MNTHENHILDAVEILSSYDFSDECIAVSVNAHAQLIAGCPPDYYESNQASTLHR